jgi:hypothetical protein
LAQGLLQLLAEIFDDLSDALLLLLRQLGKLLRAQDMPVHHRRQGVAVGGMNQRNPPLLGIVADGARRLLLTILELLLNLLCPAGVSLALKGRGDGVEQVLDQLMHVAAQMASAARGQAQGGGAVMIVEVGDIAPVVRCRRRVTPLFEGACDQGVLAEPRAAHQVEVVALVIHADTEPDGLHGPLLPDVGAQGLEVGSGLEADCGKIAGPVEILRRERSRQICWNHPSFR